MNKQIVQIKNKSFTPFLDNEEIKRIVNNLSFMINSDYTGKKPVFIIVLKGAVFFGTDLISQINLDCEIEFIKAESYGDSIVSSGKVNFKYNGTDLSGRDIIIVEDIVDTGLTMSVLMKYLGKFKPASLEAATLFSKTQMRKVDVGVKYIGMEIPPLFVLGYGLDYAGLGRNFPDIYSLDES